MKNQTPKIFLSIALSTMMLMTACSGGANAPAPSGGAGGSAGASSTKLDDSGFAFQTASATKGGAIRVLGAVDFSHLDPAMGNDGNVNNFYRLIYRQLTTVSNQPGNGGSEVVPDLATDTGTPNADATEWTYTLKDDIFFENGAPITAADVKYGLERSMDPALRTGTDFHSQFLEGASDYQGIYKDPAGLKSIELVDAKTIKFHLNQPLAAFANVAAMQVFTPFPVGTTATELDTTPISSGPYKLQKYTKGSSLTLGRNDKWTPATDKVRTAYPDNFEFLFGLDANTIDQRMISGQGEDVNAIASSSNSLQAANLSRIQTPQLKARTVRDQPACTTFMVLNTTKGPLADLKVRQAINYAIDKQSVMTATGGPALAQFASDMLTPSVPGREEFDLYPTKDNAGDPAKAKAMLAEAGYPDGFKLVMDARGIPKWKSQAEAVQASLAKVGIDVSLNVIDAAKYYEAISTPSQQHDAAITGWCSAWLSGDALMRPLFDGERIHEKGNWNISQLNDPAINKGFVDAAMITDVTKQDMAYSDLNKAIMELAPVVPLLRDTPLQMVGTNIGNAYSHAGQYGYIDYSSVGLIKP